MTDAIAHEICVTLILISVLVLWGVIAWFYHKEKMMELEIEIAIEEKRK